MREKRLLTFVKIKNLFEGTFQLLNKDEEIYYHRNYKETVKFIKNFFNRKVTCLNLELEIINWINSPLLDLMFKIPLNKSTFKSRLNQLYKNCAKKGFIQPMKFIEKYRSKLDYITALEKASQNEQKEIVIHLLTKITNKFLHSKLERLAKSNTYQYVNLLFEKIGDIITNDDILYIFSTLCGPVVNESEINFRPNLSLQRKNYDFIRYLYLNFSHLNYMFFQIITRAITNDDLEVLNKIVIFHPFLNDFSHLFTQNLTTKRVLEWFFNRVYPEQSHLRSALLTAIKSGNIEVLEYLYTTFPHEREIFLEEIEDGHHEASKVWIENKFYNGDKDKLRILIMCVIILFEIVISFFHS